MRLRLTAEIQRGGYKSAALGLVRVGEVVTVSDGEGARLLADYPGSWVDVDAAVPVTSSEVAVTAPEATRPQPVEHHRQSGRAKPRKV